MNAHDVQATLRDLVLAGANHKEEPDAPELESESLGADPFFADEESSALLSALGSVARLVDEP